MKTVSTAEELEPFRTYHRQREATRLAAREARRRKRLDAARRAIRELAPQEPAIRAVHLFGSVLEPGRFRASSDLDVAVDADDPSAESRFWRSLEDALDGPVDLRPRTGAVARAVGQGGECVYEREDPRP